MIESKFLGTIDEYKMLEPKDRVLIAVSGGADSTALLHLLDACKDKLGIALHIAHLNHNIRKGEAELDVRYVQGLAQKLKVPITVETFDVPAYAKEEGLGIEAAARQIRYAFFERIAGQVGANKIAVGHNADDNVETFLMRLLRGSGIKGLCGIPPKRGKIIRPMIKIWRREIEDYVGALKLVPRRDHSNYESKYMRNRVRLKLIPQLKIYNLNIKEIILQTILLLTEDSSYLESKAEEALAAAFISSKENELKLEADKIKKWETPIQGLLLRKAIEKVKGDLLELNFRHIQDILEKLNSDEKWELHLPGGIFAAGQRKELTISREKPAAPARKTYRYSLAIPGEIELKEIGKKLRASVSNEAHISADPLVAFVDYALLGKNLVIRNRSEGDRFIPLGMKGSKKLQDFFVDEKIPAENRDSVPVVESGARVIWLAGLRLDDRAKVTKNTKRVVKLELL
ncbi:MAG: tRNA lysidine(34) synthetase TilS [Candidatus Margulisbacteria bacterium]|nr:tRNA lysidine(34) synthetase TilS [Candidatus Margulisiibacteriota bacterium]